MVFKVPLNCPFSDEDFLLLSPGGESNFLKFAIMREHLNLIVLPVMQWVIVFTCRSSLLNSKKLEDRDNIPLILSLFGDEHRGILLTFVGQSASQSIKR